VTTAELPVAVREEAVAARDDGVAETEPLAEALVDALADELEEEATLLQERS
jgi:hypothetical protein